MTKAIHLICRRKGATYVGLTPWKDQPNGYRSCCWLLSDEQADLLIGGWVYLHVTKSEVSGFGGQIVEIEQGLDDMADRRVILFQAKESGRGQKWRGADHGMAYMSGVIAADLPHEA